MSGKSSKTILTALLVLLLTACNNNGDQNHKQSKNFNDSISSMSTDTASNNYPHTVPILTQQAKYEFRIMNGQQGTMQDNMWANEQETPPFALQEEPVPTPNQQQDIAQAPTQKKRQNVAQAPTQNQTQNTTQAKKQTKQAAPATGISQLESRVIELTNVERRKNGLPDLKADTSLSGVARKKADDMQTKHYFSHTSPTYGSPFDMMRDFGISYTAAGENIAQGQTTPAEVVQAWMNSEGHRKNILSGNFTHIGVGFSQQGNYWSQMFIKK